MRPPFSPPGQLWAALVLGGILGIFHEFLRPLRVRRNWPADLLFTAGMLWAWVLLAFPVCGTQVKPLHLALFGAGALGSASLAGPGLQPVFRGFWQGIRAGIRFFLIPGEKFLKIIMNFSKFLYAILKKSVTIVKYTRNSDQKRTGGAYHGQK